MTLVATAAARQLLDDLALAIVRDPDAVRSDAREGVFARPVHLAASSMGLAIVGQRTAEVFRWREVRRIRLRRHSIVIDAGTTRPVTRSLRLVVDDVEEPALSDTFSRVLQEMSGGMFRRDGSAWHEYQNAHDLLRPQFTDQDDHLLPVTAFGLWLAIGLVACVVIAVAVASAHARAIPPQTFTIGHRVTAIDPRNIAAAFAASALLTALSLRLALGPQAAVWMRGVARGWQERGSRTWRAVIRLLARALLAQSSSAAVLLLALLAFWPNIAGTVLVNAQGVRHEVLLPFISVEERWTDTLEIAGLDPDGAGSPRAVLIRFRDGRAISTDGADLGGGTPAQLFEYATRWRAAAMGKR